tara:strand:+ start:1589 stop:2449 length:861 start_codon:yes stop_codon:yes gene_type:complete
MQKIKNLLKKTFLYKQVRYFLDRRVYKGKTKINILETFPSFVSNGWGLYPIRAKLTVQSINQVIPGLSSLSELNEKKVSKINTIDVDDILKKESDDFKKLRDLFNEYGSDKATTHDYYKLYASLFPNPTKVKKVFEIGLGTNNTDIVSTMGKKGSPGASLRAFRDYYENAEIFGADFDKRILFSEDRIKTFFVDQTDEKTFDDLGEIIGGDFDLMIDDGLHSPNANIHSLKFFIGKINIGGWAIIEDVCPKTHYIWSLASAVLPENFSSIFISTKNSNMFIVQRNW